jgi:putative DNA primase/helicase
MIDVSASAREKARGRWKAILAPYVDLHLLTGKHVKCPVCGGKDRFRFDDKEGRGTFYCNHCKAGDGITLLRRVANLSFPQAVEVIDRFGGSAIQPPATPALGSSTASEAKSARARSLWEMGVPITAGAAAHTYLESRLGNVSVFESALRSSTKKLLNRVFPVLLAAYRDLDGRVVGVQETLLTPDGAKAPDVESARRNSGLLPAGGAVRLAEHREVLGIAEGVETALAASLLFGVPVWAALNANRLQNWRPPVGVKRVIVFADADENGVGQRAANLLAACLQSREVRVSIELPAVQGTDWNDVLMAGRMVRPTALSGDNNSQP